MVRPRARRPVRDVRRLLPPAVRVAPSASCAPGSSSSARPGAARRDGRRSATGSAGGPARLPRPGGVLTGSHLDSVLDGGAYDGPLGVVSALAASTCCGRAGSCRRRPIGVGVFVEEEGSRFGLACLGSRLATGADLVGGRAELRDRDGVALGDVAEGGGAGAAGRRRDVRRAARRAGPRPRRPRRRGRGGQRDLAARALPVRLRPARPTTPGRPGWRTGATRC